MEEYRQIVHYRLLEQIESSSTSVSMNLAEGKGRYSKKEFIQYCYIDCIVMILTPLYFEPRALSFERNPLSFHLSALSGFGLCPMRSIKEELL